MSDIIVTIDGKQISVPTGSTILDAAKRAQIRIPTLCHLENQEVKGVCRICVVEVEGARTLQPACATPVRDGMVVHTDTEAVRASRKTNLALILAHHPMDCQSCVRMENCHIEDLEEDLCNACLFCDCVKKDQDCELCALVEEYDVNGMPFEWTRRTEPEDVSTASIIRNPNKCIECRRCIAACAQWQDMHVLGLSGRGAELHVGTVMGIPLANTKCVECGQCVRVCPVGAVFEHQDLDRLPEAITDKGKTVTVRIEPYFLEQYLRLAELDSEKYGMGHLVAGLKRLGVDCIVSNQYEENNAEIFLRRELLHADKPVISAFCPAAVRFVQQEFPLLSGNISRVHSPQKNFGKTHETEYTVSLSPCSAKKAEAQRDVGRNVDQVMSPREIHRLFRRSGVDLTKLAPVDMDGQIAKTHEVREAGIETGTLQIEERTVRYACVRGLRAARKLLEEVSSGAASYDYIQLQSCPEGCISTNAWII